jgi:uncharacterized membrane protein
MFLFKAWNQHVYLLLTEVFKICAVLTKISSVFFLQRSPSASLEEIERFAKLFKRRRIALGWYFMYVRISLSMSDFMRLLTKISNFIQQGKLPEEQMTRFGHFGTAR